MCGGDIGCQSDCCPFIGNLSCWLLSRFSLSLLFSRVTVTCLGMDPWIHSAQDLVCLFILIILSFPSGKFSDFVSFLSFWNSFQMYVRSRFIFCFLSLSSFISVSLCSTFWAVSLFFFSLSSLIFYAQFVSKLPIECGCLIGMQRSNYDITCEYSSVTIIQVRIEGIACSLKQLLRQYSPKDQCSFNFHHHRSVLLVLSFVWMETYQTYQTHLFVSQSLSF